MLYGRLREVYSREGLSGVVVKAGKRISSELDATLIWPFYSRFLTHFLTARQLARKHRTDKAAKDHTFRGYSYLDVYERYFRPLKRRPINLLEIGVKEGRSLRLWKAYFPKAKIYGLDIDPACKQYEEDRISIEIGRPTNAYWKDWFRRPASSTSLSMMEATSISTY